MATYNNKHWLLSHIRNSFISTDDTGLCEMVMLGEDFPRQLHSKYKEELKNPEKNADYFCYPGFEESEDEEADILAQSYDLQFDMDFGHRLRSNTAQRLEKMDIAKKKAAKIKTIKWEEGDSNAKFTEEERSNFFQKKKVESRKQTKFNSKFSEQLKSCADLPMNQFIHFGGVDGTAQFGVTTKSFYIFLTMLPGDLRDYPMLVTVIATASIGELIGLICYKCSLANPTVCLKPVQYYALYITEDDGEVSIHKLS
ncbi:stress-activated map kinase-interacting protein 1 [Ctenocephalides felis]|uniref:stress-activated map kinase-interacting protein 1 n=1 Tax=Ctenocephalides felis TaxID=7515 RepID=UPI000E6E3FA2|nr:stress-activated map kinase-interacting protein 1 [Ctenocephalides felis]